MRPGSAGLGVSISVRLPQRGTSVRDTRKEKPPLCIASRGTAGIR